MKSLLALFPLFIDFALSMSNQDTDILAQILLQNPLEMKNPCFISYKEVEGQKSALVKMTKLLMSERYGQLKWEVISLKKEALEDNRISENPVVVLINTESEVANVSDWIDIKDLGKYYVK